MYGNLFVVFKLHFSYFVGSMVFVFELSSMWTFLVIISRKISWCQMKTKHLYNEVHETTLIFSMHTLCRLRSNVIKLEDFFFSREIHHRLSSLQGCNVSPEHLSAPLNRNLLLPDVWLFIQKVKKCIPVWSSYDMLPATDDAQPRR